MSWITWAAGLVFLDIIFIVLASMFGADPLMNDYNVPSVPNSEVIASDLNSSSVIDSTSTGWIEGLTLTWSGLPSWLKYFLVVYNIALLLILGMAFLRGVT